MYLSCVKERRRKGESKTSFGLEIGPEGLEIVLECIGEIFRCLFPNVGNSQTED
jgi:hypothetical protein